MQSDNSNKNSMQNKLPEKSAAKTPPVKPPASKISYEECPYGREFAFFYRRFMRVL